MKSTLKMVLAVAIVLVGLNAMAEVNDSWTPSGNISVQVATKNIHPTLSFDKYDKPQSLVDGWLNLPAGLALELSEYAGLNNDNLDGDKGDEFDAALWEKITLPENAYLKFRLKWCDGYPVQTANGKDAMAYDAFIGKSYKQGANKVTFELRAEYWHYVQNVDKGMVSIVPNVTHEYQVGKFTAYDQLVLQWNNELKPFGELLSGQAKVGVKVKLTPNLTWNILDIWGITPISPVEKGDPRQGQAVAFETMVTRTF